MGVRYLSFAVAASALSLAIGCEVIGGIEEISLVDPAQDAGSDAQPDVQPDVQPDAPGTCELSGEGGAFLRLGNLMPSDQAVDFCVKPADGSIEDVQPLIASSGAWCPAGLRYKDVTVAFRVATGQYDVRVVPAGASDCSSGTADVEGVQASENLVTSVFAFAEADGAHQLSALPESPAQFNKTQLRFVHGLAGHDVLDFGATDTGRLPATLLTSVSNDVPFGAAAPAGTSDVGSIDANGYLAYSAAGSTLWFAIAEPGSTDAFAALTARFALNSSHTVFAIGNDGDPDYPPSLWSCDEGGSLDGVLATCGDPVDLSVEVFSTQLTDLFTPLYRERLDPVIDAVQHANSDVICINETRRTENLDAVLAAASSVYPYVVAAHQVAISESDLTTQEGNEPSPYTEAACGGTMTQPMQDLMDCVDANCTTDSGEGHYFTHDGDVGARCVSDKCIAKLPALMLGGEAGQACWMCVLTQMSGEESTEYVQEACSTDPDARFAYRGSLGLAVLSKVPIGAGGAWLLPSTGWQRGVLRVPLELANGVPLDFYCGDMTVPVAGVPFPYVGHYGGDAEGDKRWIAEQLLQAERLAGIVDAQTGASGARVVLADTTYAGPEYLDGSTRVLAAQSPEVYDALLESFEPLTPPGHVPACTQCVNNPVLSGLDPADLPSADTWTSHLLGRGIARDAVLETTVTFTEAKYEVEAPEGLRTVPPSSHYGLRSVLRITQ